MLKQARQSSRRSAHAEGERDQSHVLDRGVGEQRFTSRWRERKKAATATETRPNPMSRRARERALERAVGDDLTADEPR